MKQFTITKVKFDDLPKIFAIQKLDFAEEANCQDFLIYSH